MTPQRLIGVGNRLPWRLSADLKHFKTVTMGHPIIMGRRTFESIGRPLPGRRNIVLSRTPHYTADGCDVFDSLKAALKTVREESDVFVIGGAAVYREALSLADRLYITEVDTDGLEGDTYFPPFDKTAWTCTHREEHPADEKNA